MSLLIQACNLNGTIVDIDLSHVPELSTFSINFLSKLGASLSPSLQSGSSLAERVQVLEKMIGWVQDSTENICGEQHAAILKTALIALITGGMAAAYLYGGVVGGAVFLVGYIACLALTFNLYQTLCHTIKRLEVDLPGYTFPWHAHIDMCIPVGLLGGNLLVGIAAICEVFQRKSHIQQMIHQEQQWIAKQLSKLKEYNQQILPEAYSFYCKQAPHIVEQLDRTIRGYQTSLAVAQMGPSLSPVGYDTLQAHIASYQRARDELQAVIQFYTLMQPIQGI